MNQLYSGSKARPFVLWKWLLFGALFLVTINMAAALLQISEVSSIGIGLGFMITAKMMAMPQLRLSLKIASGIGLVFIISLTAIIASWLTCLIEPTWSACSVNNFRAITFGIFFFPLVIVLLWAVFEILQAIGKYFFYPGRFTNPK